jgi:hypothetical protein
LGEEREDLEGALGASAHPWLERRRTSNSSPGPEPHVSEPLIAAFKIAVTEEQFLEGQRTAQKGGALQMRCTHTEVRTAEPLITDRPHELLTPLPRHVPRAWMDPRFGRGI